LDKVTGEIKSKYDTKSNTAIDQWLHPEKAEEKAKEAQNAAKEAQDKQVGTEFLTAIQKENITEDWTQKPITFTVDGKNESKGFKDLSDTSKKTVIEGINAIEDGEKKKLFGKRSPTIEI
jgi:hypothetical protein